MEANIRHFRIADIPPVSTSHGCGCKRVLLSKDDTETALTQIAFTRLKAGEECGWHEHPTMEECFLIKSGELRIETKDDYITARAGDYIQLPKATPHNVVALTDTEMLTIGCAVSASMSDKFSEIVSNHVSENAQGSNGLCR